MTPSFFRGVLLVLGVSLPLHTGGAIDLLHAPTFGVEAGAVQTNELWVAANDLTLEGTMKRDVYLYTPRPLVIAGPCQEDVFALAMSGCTLTGPVLGDLKVASPNGIVDLKAAVEGSVVAAGSAIQVSGASGFREGFLMGREVIVEGHIKGDLKVFGNAVTINAVVDGSLRCIASEMVVMAGTRIGGDLVYTMEPDLVLRDDVQVGGEVKRAPMPVTFFTRSSRSLKERVFLQCYWLAGAVLAGAVWLWLFPVTSQRSAEILLRQPVRCCLWGSITFLLLVLVTFLGVGLLIGVPFALMVALLFTPIVYFSKILAAFGLGCALKGQGVATGWRSRFVLLISGLTIIYGISLLDVIQPMVWMLTVTGGLGAWFFAIRYNERDQVAMGPTEPPPLPENQ